MIIAVDFDGTLYSGENIFPRIGKPNNKLIQYLLWRQSEGDELILWTCRASGKGLEEAVEWCEKQGLIFDEVNANLPRVIEAMGGDSRKILADVYIDDKNAVWDSEVANL